MAKEIQKAKNTIPVKSDSELTDMMEFDQGAGFEDADKAAFAIPFLVILQSGSPQVKKSDGAYIKGAQEGMLFNSVTHEIFDGEEGVVVVPCYYQRRFTRWAARDSGGGFKGEYLPSDPIVLTVKGEEGEGRGNFLPDEKGEYRKKTSDILNDTRSHFVLLLGDKGVASPALVSMTSTQIKKSKNWMSKMDALKIKRADGTQFTPPMFSHSYRLTTVPENNDQGSWYGWKIELEKQVSDVNVYRQAKAFRDSVKAGTAKAAEPELHDDE